MPGTDNLVAVQFAAGNFRPIMRADIFNGIKTAAYFKNGDIGAVDIDNNIFAIRQGVFIDYIEPFGHVNLSFLK